jgi:flavin-dependent dehydrogenase
MPRYQLYDVVILGGGLAGLTLARQLKQERPETRVLVLEKWRHPVQEAAFKVGESTVEIAGHYYAQVLGLAPHLVERQLFKFGLRYFFDDGVNRDLARRFELGPIGFPRIKTFQLDRGRLENHLFSTNPELGVEQIDGVSVRDVEFGNPLHRVTFSKGFGVSGGSDDIVTTRWVVDASGRAGIIKRKLGLRREVAHAANASWWRIRARVRIDDWSHEPAWQARVKTGCRWLSTNHLMGRGYWVWLIPLASDSTSFGIVADAALHPFGAINRPERALQWLDRHEPQCADVVRAHLHLIEDFKALRQFAHGCAQVFSGDRWCLTGEAGVFTDPFYSPGSDFISIGNDFISELVGRDLAGEDITAHAARFNRFYLHLFEAYLKVYESQYPIMGNARVMTAKVAWDNACYWGITALIYFQRRYRDLVFLESIEPLMRRFFVLHTRMQQFLREWSSTHDDALGPGFMNLIDVDFLGRLQASLDVPHDCEQLREQLHVNLGLLERFAMVLRELAGRTADQTDPATLVPEESRFAAILGEGPTDPRLTSAG